MDASAMENSAAGRAGDLLMARLAELATWTGAVRRWPPVFAEGSAAAAIEDRHAPETWERHVARVSSIADAREDCCVFATSAGALEQALGSRAGAILASFELQPVVPAALRDDRVLWVDDARYGFAQVAHALQPRRESGEVHPTASVAADAQVGPRTVIEAGAFIGAGVHVGADCRLGPRSVILQDTVVGDRVLVQAGAVLGSTGFGYVRHRTTGEYLPFPQQGTLVVEDDVEIGANTTIDRGALGETRVGRGTKIDNLVHVGHNCRIGQNVIIAAQTGIAGSSVVEDGAVLGGQVGIADHVHIGPGVILGAQAGVPSGKRLAGAGQVFWGTPARPIEQYLRDMARLRRGQER